MKICEAKICLWSKENMGLPQMISSPFPTNKHALSESDAAALRALAARPTPTPDGPSPHPTARRRGARRGRTGTHAGGRGRAAPAGFKKVIKAGVSNRRRGKRRRTIGKGIEYSSTYGKGPVGRYPVVVVVHGNRVHNLPPTCAYNNEAVPRLVQERGAGIVAPLPTKAARFALSSLLRSHD